MYIYQGLVLLALFVLMFNSHSRYCASVIFIIFCVYLFFIMDLDAICYYSLAALKDLITGLLLERKNKNAAICSYLLVITNLFGFYLWYAYYDPLWYDFFCCIIILIQVLTIIPKGLISYGRNGDREQSVMDVSDDFVCNKACDNMYKIPKKKTST